MKLLWKITGGRPMRLSHSAFYAHVSRRMVMTYLDRLGRRWLATGKWGLVRVRLTDTEGK
jgi:hypothetical protein